MAVETTTAFSGPYTANGATTSFGFTFIAKASDEIGVLLRDSDGVDSVVSTSAYTVTLNANGTGTVVFATAPASGNSVYIYSDVSFQHSIDFEDGTGWKAAPVNETSDRAALRDIWLKDRVERGIYSPVGEAGIGLPSAANRANKFLAFNEDGDGIAAVGSTGSGVPVGAFGAVLAGAETVDEALSDLGVTAGGVALGQLNRLMSKMEGEQGDASIVILTDSTGDAATEWPYLLFNGSFKEAYPEWTIDIRYWSAGSYAAATRLQTGTGARTLTVWVAAVAGSAANRFAVDDFTAAASTPDPDVILVSYGHNGDVQGAPGSYTIRPLRQLSFFSALAWRLQNDLPQVPVVAIGQNPSINDTGSNPVGTDDGFMETRLKVLRPFYARKGWGYIDVHGAFQASATALSALLVDTVHPNATGSQLWADTVWGVMAASAGAVQTGQNAPSKLLRSWTDLYEINKWTKSNVTLSKQTTAGRYLSGGNSVTATATSTAAASYLSIRGISSDDIPEVAGKYVTFAVCVRVPTANTGNSARLDVDDGVTAFSGFAGAQEGDTAFQLFSATHYVSPLATYVDLTIYLADAAASPASVLDIEWMTISLGQDALGPPDQGFLAGRTLNVFGSSPNGLGALYNVNTAAAGLRFIPSDTADPASAWVSDFRGDGFAVKNTADSNPRYEVTQTGGFRMGPGSGATDMGIDRQTSGVMRFSGADIYPDTNGTRYIGASTNEWRGLFLKGAGAGDGLFVNNVKIIGQQGAAVADATGGATVDTEARTAINTLLARLRAHGIIAT